MKRAILLFAAASVMTTTGCYTNHCNVDSLTLYWTFVPSTGGAALGCNAAGVATVSVFIDGQPYNGPGTNPDLACDPFNNGVEGISLTNFFPGTYQVQLEGRDANGNLLYLDQRSVVVNACNTVAAVALTAQTGDLNITYSLPGNACVVPTGTSGSPTTLIWFQLRDSNGQIVSSVDFSHGPTTLPCDNANPAIVIPGLLFGQYTLDGIEEVQLDANGQTVIVYSYNCTPSVPFNHLQNGDTLAAPGMIAQQGGGTVTCF